jgi:HK97 family phage major capsid protein
LQRDLYAANGASGGYLVNTDVLPAADILRPWSVAARAGISIIENVVGNQTLPKTTAKTSIEWLTDETDAGTESQPTLSQVAATPKIAIGLLNLSRQLIKQSNAEAVIRRELLKTAGSAVDQAIFAGSGASGQPLGLINTPGIDTESGSTLAHTGVVDMKRAVADANAPDESIAFIATPTVRGLLEGRARATGLGFIWDNNRVAGVPGYATTDLPTGTLVCGSWPLAVLLLWGNGIELQLNPYHNTGFKSGMVQARVLITCDTMFVHPAAFSVASSVS